jgi:hypothetical protein
MIAAFWFLRPAITDLRRRSPPLALPLMSRKTHRTGAVATVCMLIVTLFALEGSGAAAQNEEWPAQAVTVGAGTAELLIEETLLQEPLPRFVSEPVVQPVPEEDEGAPLSEAESLHELVTIVPADEGLSRDMECLAQAIYFEARGEPLSGQLAVGRVIVNRTQSPLFPSDYCSVVTQPAQFSFVKKGRIPAVRTTSTAWQRAKAIAVIAHQELWESEAQDALFFHATYVRPSWARQKMARATIDSHIFYR